MSTFEGFDRPESDFYRLPNNWFDTWTRARQTLAQGKRPARILAPLKVTEYVIKHTWGWQNFDRPMRLSRTDLLLGVRGKKRQRLDLGTGLSDSVLSRAIELACALGMLQQIEINQDRARQERLYLPRLKPSAEDETEAHPNEIFTGFNHPKANFFIVPKIWMNIVATISSEVLIIVMEYFFRHTWGWQNEGRKICWLNIDEVAKGREYKSEQRDGETYDQGIGYTTRQVRDALTEAVERKLLVWRYREDDGCTEYALRMNWMKDVDSEGYFDPSSSLSSNSHSNQHKIKKLFVEKDGVVVEKDGVVTEKDGVVVEKDGVVTEKDGVDNEKLGGRTCKDTIKDTTHKTLNQDTPRQPPTTIHTCDMEIVVGDDIYEMRNLLVYFRPVLENDDLGEVRELTIREAADILLLEVGGWYWSREDIVRPKLSDEGENFTALEIAAQIALDCYMLGEDNAIFVNTDGECAVLSLIEITRLLATDNTNSQSIFWDVWELLNLSVPVEAEQYTKKRWKKFEYLRSQNDFWGDPDLVIALEKINISTDKAQCLIRDYGAGVVGSWLRALRANQAGIISVAAVLISNLKRGLTPPQGPIQVVECIPSNQPTIGQARKDKHSVIE